MEIQRYDATLVDDMCGNKDVLMRERHDGLFVRHEDHLAALAAQQEEVDRVKADLDAEVLRLQRARIGDAEIIGRWQCEAEGAQEKCARSEQALAALKSYHSNVCDSYDKSVATLEVEKRNLERELQRHASIEEKSHLQTIDERDRAEEALSQAYYLVVGHSPEWSNLFGHDEAINDIDDAQKCLRAEVAAQQEEIDRLKGQWEEHTKHVGRFLTEMYQTMIDPLDEPEPSLKIAELCEMLLNQAREDREKLNRSPFNWPADWNKDSSLETWFPLTAEELTRVKAENAKLQARLDAMSAPVSDEEMIAHAIHWIDVVQPKRRLPVLTDTQVNMLLAARAKTEATK